MGDIKFTWTSYYAEFADRLLPFRNNRKELLEIIKAGYNQLNMRYPFLDGGEPLDDICPFTIFGCFNKGMTDEHRIAVMNAIGKKIGVTAQLPQEFDGIPVVNNLRAWFFAYKADRKPDDINNLWSLFENAIKFADDLSANSKDAFINDYDRVLKQFGVKWNITMGLYWIRPYSFLNLDEVNRKYLLDITNPLAAGLKSVAADA